MRENILVRNSCKLAKIVFCLALITAFAPSVVVTEAPDPLSNAVTVPPPSQSFEKLNRMLSRYEVFEIDLDQVAAQVQAAGRISIELDHVRNNVVLRLRNLRSEKIQWTQTTASGIIQESLPPVSTYEGEIEGEPDSQVRLLIRRDLFLGYIRKGDDWLFIDPLSLYVPGANVQQGVAYHEADIRPEYQGVCGTTPLRNLGEHLDGLHEGVNSKLNVQAVSLQQFHVATDADFEFYQTHGFSSNSFIEGILNEVDGIYRSQLNLTLNISAQNVYTTASQPYTSTDASTLLGKLRTEWNSHRSGIQRDVVHLYTGKNLNGNVVGVAYLDVVCSSPTTAYGLTSGTIFQAKVSAHEIGHNFNAVHDDQVTPPAAVCDGTGPLMCSAIQRYGPEEFSQRSKDDIGFHLITEGSCLIALATPLVTTDSPAAVTAGSATLNATVNPNGYSTSINFQWGVTTSYGSTTADQLIGIGISGIPVTASLTGLLPNTTYHYRVVATNSLGSTYGNDVTFVTFSSSSGTRLFLANGEVKVASTTGNGSSVQAGYATVQVNSGGVPYGTAVFSLSQNGAVVSEAGVPASPPTNRARLYIEFRTIAAGKSSDETAGTIQINTGLALVNPGGTAANITFHLRDFMGEDLAQGGGTLPANEHVAKFIDELIQIAPDFVLPADFSSSVGVASLDVLSDQPVSVVGLRLVGNQRGETLVTTTPVADLQKGTVTDPLYFPHITDGGGFKTSIILLNTSGVLESGTLQIFDDTGLPLAVHREGDSGAPSSLFSYGIPAGGLFIFRTDGAPASVKAGSVQVMPYSGTFSPVGAGVLSYSSGGIVVTESGIPSATLTRHARIFVDYSGGHDTGIAIEAPAGPPVYLTFSAFQKDGMTPAGTGFQGLASNGHTAKFANQFIPALSEGFTGVLDISAPYPFAALTLRSLKNIRGDFLITTFPIADFAQPAPAPVIFPQIVDGGNYRTQFILLNTSGAAMDTLLNTYGDNGGVFSLGKTSFSK